MRAGTATCRLRAWAGDGLREPFRRGAGRHVGSGLRSETDKPLPKPFKLAPDVRLGLEAILRSQQLFAVQGEGLSVITCRKGAGEYTVGIANNTWREQPFRLESLCGKVESLRELPLDTSEAGAPGQTPEVVDGSKLGKNSAGTIAGGDVRMFAVKVQETGVEEIQHQARRRRVRGAGSCRCAMRPPSRRRYWPGPRSSSTSTEFAWTGPTCTNGKRRRSKRSTAGSSAGRAHRRGLEFGHRSLPHATAD